MTKKMMKKFLRVKMVALQMTRYDKEGLTSTDATI